MLKILASSIMIIGGIALIIFSCYYNKTKDKTDKYCKYKKLLDIVVGIFYIILGSVLNLNIYNDNLIVAFSSIILLIDRAIEFKLRKRFQNLD